MPQKIKFHWMSNGATVRWAHLSQQADLILEGMLNLIRDATAADEEPDAITELGEAWFTDELMKFATISIYNMWEKQLKSLIQEQLGWSKSQISKALGQNDADRLLHILEFELLAPTSLATRALIDEARQLANLVKHDPGTGYAAVEALYPAHFVAGVADAEDRFRISPAFVKLVAAELARFWENLPIELDHTTS